LTQKIRVLLDYPVQDHYNGQTLPAILFYELKKDIRFEVLLPDRNKTFKNLDILIIFAAGNHYKFSDDILASLLSKELIKKLSNKFKKQIVWLGYFFGLYKLGYYKNHLFRNFAYEKRIKRIINQNDNLKVIHRLDGMYKIICKNYDVDKSVKKLNELSDLTIHQSEYSKIIWNKDIKTIFGEQKQLNSKNQIMIRNGVNTNIFNTSGDKINLKGKWKILHVSASSNPNKNLRTVLEMANILKDNNEFQFYLIGNQINDPICGEDIKKFSNCHFIGHIKNREEIAKYYRSCDIFIFPAKDDCSPNVVLEAMSSGLPVITIDSGGNLELIRKGELKGGVILNDSNPILAVKTIVDNYSFFKKNCLQIIKKYYDISLIVETYKKEILRLAKKT
jgi:glycosyltransferase involved in cell wall biosynthesis